MAKDGKRSTANSKKTKRERSHARLLAKKNRNVERSSHGKFKSVTALESHRKLVSN